MRKLADKIDKALIFTQGQYGLTHHAHTQHQDTKTQQDLPKIFAAAAFGQHLHGKANCQNQGYVISEFKKRSAAP